MHGFRPVYMYVYIINVYIYIYILESQGRAGARPSILLFPSIHDHKVHRAPIHYLNVPVQGLDACAVLNSHQVVIDFFEMYRNACRLLMNILRRPKDSSFGRSDLLTYVDPRLTQFESIFFAANTFSNTMCIKENMHKGVGCLVVARLLKTMSTLLHSPDSFTYTIKRSIFQTAFNVSF